MVVDHWSSCLTKGDRQFALWCFFKPFCVSVKCWNFTVANLGCNNMYLLHKLSKELVYRLEMEDKELSFLSTSCYCLWKASLMKGCSSIYPLYSPRKISPEQRLAVSSCRQGKLSCISPTTLFIPKLAWRLCHQRAILHSVPHSHVWKTNPVHGAFVCLLSALMLLYASLSCHFCDSGFTQTKNEWIFCYVLWSAWSIGWCIIGLYLFSQPQAFRYCFSL